VIRAVTFDAAGTLIAPAEAVGDTYARTAARFGISVRAGDVDAAFRRALADAPPLAFPDVAAHDLARHERDWWRAVVRAALGGAGSHGAFEACFDALFAHYATPGAWRVYTDARPCLEAARARGLRTAVVSNFDRRLPSLLDGLGLSRAVDRVLSSTQVGAAKPAVAIFAAAAAALGVDIGEICHVGDDLRADVGGARAAGASALYLDRSGRTPGALVTLDRLLEALDADQP